jgi:hypothetical protein
MMTDNNNLCLVDLLSEGLAEFLRARKRSKSKVRKTEDLSVRSDHEWSNKK